MKTLLLICDNFKQFYNCDHIHLTALPYTLARLPIPSSQLALPPHTLFP